MFTTKLMVKMLTHNFLDKLEMTTRAVISSLSRIAADCVNELTYRKSNSNARKIILHTDKNLNLF